LIYQSTANHFIVTMHILKKQLVEFPGLILCSIGYFQAVTVRYN